ncbi:MAG: glycosyltransferase [Isosphaeraceae bacterium]
MGTDDRLFTHVKKSEECIGQHEPSLFQSRAEIEDTPPHRPELKSPHEENHRSLFRRLQRRLACADELIALPGSQRRRLLHLGHRCLRAVPKLRDRDWVEHRMGVAWNRARGSLGLLLRPCRVWSMRLGDRLRRDNAIAIRPASFPVRDRVEVSIIIPAYNHCADTLACLESIERLTNGPAYEVIVVDDCSTDETPTQLRRVDGLVLIRNDRNLGFIGSCNRGAAAARGDYLIFLNNDTVVTPGWLEALARTFREIPGTGLAGAKLVYPDGRLQEAGGMIWRDASGWNYGKYDNPDHPRYNFAREVDYCSGACVMVPRVLFEDCGGFDSHFAPAYYEDADLAFKIRQAGYKVVYQPLATIVHHEGLTSGRSTNSGAKSHQTFNQSKFRHRWDDRLASHPMPQQAHVRIVHPHGVNTGRRGQVLIIDHHMPTPNRDAGSVRMLEIMNAVRRGEHHVIFLPADLLALPPYQQQLQGIGVEVIHHPYYRSVAGWLKRHGRELDMVIVSRAEIAARHLASVKRLAPQAKVVFDTVDLHFLREDREARLKQDPSLYRAVARRKEQELSLVRLADLTLVVSCLEREILLKQCPGADVRIIPTIYPVPPADRPGLADRKNIVFIGGFEHPPNADAVRYFASEIFPRVLARIPDARFQVIGPEPTPEIRALAGGNIEVLGFVPDVTPYFDRARLAVAPLRFGAGVKGKVNQSMAFGVPTVVSSIAAEGMYLVHEENALIADNPASFAEAVVRVWTSPDLWERLSTHGRENVEKYFSVNANAQRIDELLSWAGLSTPGRDPAEAARL